MIALESLVETQQRDTQFSMKTYGRAPVAFVRGKAARLWDDCGNEYLDFLAGIAVCGLGHCHPSVTTAISEQASQLVHVSNLFHTEHQSLLAKEICDLTGMERVFFCNSGTEANETAIKLARKWGRKYKNPGSTQIVTLTHGFHGRTLGSLAATAKPQYQASFEPMPGGFTYVSAGEARALDTAITDRTCAVLLEPVQGEGGVHVLVPEFLHAARQLCDERNVLLIADEVQCGLGRTGRFLASEHAGILPDVVTLAKGIANGVPMGACLARGSAAEIFEPGDHGCTFGGNPLSCAAALATLDVVQDEQLTANARVIGDYLLAKLECLATDFPKLVNEVRGLGLMIGIELLEPNAKKISLSLLSKGVVVGTAGDNVIRLLPPLIIDHADCDEFLERFELVLSEMTAKDIL